MLGVRESSGADRFRIPLSSRKISNGASHFRLDAGIMRGKGRRSMFSTYTAKYTKIKSGYMGQLVEWPEVVTEGKTLEDCRAMLQDALREMIRAYRQQKKEIPVGGALLEQIPARV